MEVRTKLGYPFTQHDLPFFQVAYRKCRVLHITVAVLTLAKVPKHVSVQFRRKHSSLPLTGTFDLLVPSSSLGTSY